MKHIVIREHKSETAFVSQNNKGKFLFDTYMDGGENDTAFDLRTFDILLVDGEEYYYSFAEELEPEEYKAVKIGELQGHYYDIERMRLANYDIMDAFDMRNGDECSLGEEMLNIYGNGLNPKLIKKMSPWAPENFFHIDEIKLDEQYRNKGYGTAILSNIDRMLYYGCHYNCSFVTLQPNPLDEDKHNKVEEIDKLEKFYKRCGFFKLNKDDYAMIKVLNEFINEN